MLNIPITNDELLEADANDFDVLIVNFTSNCSIRSRSPREVQVQILDEDSELSGPVDGTHSSGYMHCIVLCFIVLVLTPKMALSSIHCIGAGCVYHRRLVLCWQQLYQDHCLSCAV